MNDKHSPYRIPYREKMVKNLSLELGRLAAECKTKAQFEQESLSFLYGLFDRFDIEAKEYYRLCHVRAIILAFTKWTGDMENG